MTEFLEVLKYTLPIIVFTVAIYFIIKHFSAKDESKYKYDLIAKKQKILTPMRLQSYERIILFLERIRVESLALRLQNSKMSAMQLQIMMTATVRKEYNHNLSQQLYISSKAWSAVRNAKEMVLRSINITGTNIGPNAKASTFSRAAMETYSNLNTTPVETAIEILKSEVQTFFDM